MNPPPRLWPAYAILPRPAFSGARLVVRNDREAALYELPLAE